MPRNRQRVHRHCGNSSVSRYKRSSTRS